MGRNLLVIRINVSAAKCQCRQSAIHPPLGDGENEGLTISRCAQTTSPANLYAATHFASIPCCQKAVPCHLRANHGSQRNIAASQSRSVRPLTDQSCQRTHREHFCCHCDCLASPTGLNHSAAKQGRPINPIGY